MLTLLLSPLLLLPLLLPLLLLPLLLPLLLLLLPLLLAFRAGLDVLLSDFSVVGCQG
jgi:hypothetical protein